MEISQITDDLYLGTTPRGTDYDRLRELGVELVLNLRIERPPTIDRHNPPMASVWLPSFDSPLIPIPISFLRRGTQAALKVLSEGGKVFIHCAAGVHRSVAQTAAILIAQGYSAEDAMELIKEKRPVADPDVWYIRRRILRFAETWSSHE